MEIGVQSQEIPLAFLSYQDTDDNEGQPGALRSDFFLSEEMIFILFRRVYSRGDNEVFIIPEALSTWP